MIGSVFFFFFLHLSTSACKNLWVVPKKVLLLSHGQAAVERGFLVNKNLSTDMEAKSIISKRIIVDHVRSVSKVVNVRSDKELWRYFRVARRRYELHLESEKTSFKQLLDYADRLALQAEKERKIDSCEIECF